MSILSIAENRMAATDRHAAEIYDRVAGKAVDAAYEALRRVNTEKMIGAQREQRARKLVWC